MNEIEICEVGHNGPYHPWMDRAGLILAALLAAFILLSITTGCNSSEDLIEIMGSESETDTGEPCDLPVALPPDLPDPEYPMTTLVDACCWCEGNQSHCATLDQITAVDCLEIDGAWYQDCILITGIEPDPEPYCWEHTC